MCGKKMWDVIQFGRNEGDSISCFHLLFLLYNYKFGTLFLICFMFLKICT